MQNKYRKIKEGMALYIEIWEICNVFFTCVCIYSPIFIFLGSGHSSLSHSLEITGALVTVIRIPPYYLLARLRFV